MKNFRKPYLAFIMACILLVSCSENKLIQKEEFTFDLTAYETYKNRSLAINFPENLGDGDLFKKYNLINELINEEYGTNLQLTDLDIKHLNNFSKGDDINSNAYLNDKDIKLLKSLNKDLSELAFNDAIESLKKNILSEELTSQEFIKYNQFVNTLLLLEKEIHGIMTTDNSSSRNLDPCAEAIASYTLATIGLAACGLTGPLAVIFCTAAIAGKILAFRAMVRDCGEDQIETKKL